MRHITHVSYCPQPFSGTFGPHIESWAFALDAIGLQTTVAAGVFRIRTCKFCTAGAIIAGEYGITNALRRAGWGVTSLLSMYSKAVRRNKKEGLVATRSTTTGRLERSCALALQ